MERIVKNWDDNYKSKLIEIMNNKIKSDKDQYMDNQIFIDLSSYVINESKNTFNLIDQLENKIMNKFVNDKKITEYDLQEAHYSYKRILNKFSDSFKELNDCDSFVYSMMHRVKEDPTIDGARHIRSFLGDRSLEKEIYLLTMENDDGWRYDSEVWDRVVDLAIEDNDCVLSERVKNGFEKMSNFWIQKQSEVLAKGYELSPTSHIVKVVKEYQNFIERLDNHFH